MLHHLLWFIFMSYDTSPIIDAWSYHMIHHRWSCHIINFITFHRFIFMSCDTSPTIDVWSYYCDTKPPVISYDTSPTIDGSCYVIDHLQSCHMIHHLPSCHVIHNLPVVSYDTSPTGHIIWYITYRWYITSHCCMVVMWYITYHRCMVMSYDISPTIDTWTFHTIHNLPTMHGHVIWYITYHRCMVMSCDTSPIIDAWSCLTVISYDISSTVVSYDTSPTIDTWSYHMIHHLPSMPGYVIWYITYHRCLVTSYDT